MIRSEYTYRPEREPFIYHNGTVLQLDKCTTKFINECYVQMKYVTHTCLLKWKMLHIDYDMSEEEWTDVFLRPYICLLEMKLQLFQYKIIYRMINCNKICSIWKSKTLQYVHTVIKQMISVISSLCVKMCINSGKGYVPGGIHLIMIKLIFQHSQMWKLSSSDRTVSLKLKLLYISHKIFSKTVTVSGQCVPFP